MAIDGGRRPRSKDRKFKNSTFRYSRYHISRTLCQRWLLEAYNPKFPLFISLLHRCVTKINFNLTLRAFYSNEFALKEISDADKISHERVYWI